MAQVDLAEGDDTLKFLNPPATLYHYTTAGGLQGILESKSLWATDLAYLNDSQELRYGLEHFTQAVLKEFDSDKEVVEVLLGQLLSGKELFRECRLMVACYCSDGDLLSQWRSYAGPGGYALGFDTFQLGTILNKDRSSEFRPFRRVFYGDDHARIFARVGAERLRQKMLPLITELKEAARSGTSEDDMVEMLAKATYELKFGELLTAMTVLSSLKHPAFGEEREWRYLSVVNKYDDTIHGIKFRLGNLGLTPYISVDIKGSDERLPINEVIVGPGPNMQLRVEAVELILEVMGYGDTVQVRASSAPFRA